MSSRETPVELFKRSLAQTTRALAGQEEELEVTFGAEGPRLSPGKVVLPHPPRVISDAEAERIRGQADGLALRLAHHDDREHARLRPQGAEARVVFDTVEEMRIQALGANALKGVSNNLTAALTDSLERRGAVRMQDKSLAPLADALALMVRERLTGLAPPQNAQALVQAWRTDIEKSAGADLDKLAAVAGDQRAFRCRPRRTATLLGRPATELSRSARRVIAVLAAMASAALLYLVDEPNADMSDEHVAACDGGSRSWRRKRWRWWPRTTDRIASAWAAPRR